MHMESVIRDVRDIGRGDRRAIENIVGQPLEDNQRVVIQIIDPDADAAAPPSAEPAANEELPDWCSVYQGLTDAEIAEIEKSIVRSHESRSPA